MQSASNGATPPNAAGKGTATTAATDVAGGLAGSPAAASKSSRRRPPRSATPAPEAAASRAVRAVLLPPATALKAVIGYTATALGVSKPRPGALPAAPSGRPPPLSVATRRDIVLGLAITAGTFAVGAAAGCRAVILLKGTNRFRDSIDIPATAFGVLPADGPSGPHVTSGFITKSVWRRHPSRAPHAAAAAGDWRQRPRLVRSPPRPAAVRPGGAAAAERRDARHPPGGRALPRNEAVGHARPGPRRRCAAVCDGPARRARGGVPGGRAPAGRGPPPPTWRRRDGAPRPGRAGRAGAPRGGGVDRAPVGGGRFGGAAAVGGPRRVHALPRRRADQGGCRVRAAGSRRQGAGAGHVARERREGDAVEAADAPSCGRRTGWVRGEEAV
ncbi:hypothetical protein BU14_0474s0006 [Porphyra umbilicalis]|uniref:Uncharacterized protein n=1 Tax=Porphyra umbilicalis TaxID=2786 RepID=A0A1X6NU78_PORUM|nr:hypothetical protein BU14_0474s0006 [Porphyra umbilicalis]|eukprot:OSX72060.1 hypothetical protein BU14_0474s0006 [Porphyra umbilicalis]